MSKDCGKREKKQDLIKGKEITDPKANLINYECKIVKEQGFYNKNNDLDIKVLFAVETAPEKICLVLSNNYILEKKISLSIFNKEYTDEITNITNLALMPQNMNKMIDYYKSNLQYNKSMLYLTKLKLLVMGGYYDGRINLFFLETHFSRYFIPFDSEFPIIKISSGLDEEYLILGNSIGNICVLKINSDFKDWQRVKVIKDIKEPISHIHYNSDLNLWLTTTINGFIYLYTLPSCKLARTIKIDTKNCSYSFLSSSPLPSIIIIRDDTNNSEILVYSINGKFITQQTLYSRLINPIILKDLNSNEFLCYIDNEAVNILSLPNLEPRATIAFQKEEEIFNIFPSQDKTSLYCLNKDGNKVYVIRDEQNK